MMKSMFARQERRRRSASCSRPPRELDVRLIACQMTMDVFGYGQDDFVDGVEFGGAAAFLSEARRAHVTLFI